ncbi:hypothetical protein SRABI91_01655 [Rhodococcoides fascians]|nr:hypothetical protein SRABI91_01655 [Rhodococcus fascians]
MVREWLGQESFWKDVTTRTVAAVLTLAIVYVFTLSAGYLQGPNFKVVSNTWQTFIQNYVRSEMASYSSLALGGTMAVVRTYRIAKDKYASQKQIKVISLILALVANLVIQTVLASFAIALGLWLVDQYITAS